MADSEEDVLDPATIGSEGPPIAEKPYKIVFEANLCIGAGKCAEVSGNWELDITTAASRCRS